MRTLLLLLSLHAACDRPTESSEDPSPASGEATTEAAPRAEAERETPAREAPPPRVPPPELREWGTILEAHATEGGRFRYEALRANEGHLAALEATVAAIGEARDQGWEKEEALAFYVNAYNALTVAAVLEAWPTESVMRVEGFFDTRTHRVAGEPMTLNALEREILRSERFAEPRVHFLVSCASKSCPPLDAEAFTAANVDAKMAAAARAFVKATTTLSPHVVRVSRIFEWFATDFGGLEGVRAFVAAQLDDEAAAAHVMSARTTLGYHDYDWALNAHAEPSGESGSPPDDDG